MVQAREKEIDSILDLNERTYGCNNDVKKLRHECVVIVAAAIDQEENSLPSIDAIDRLHDDGGGDDDDGGDQVVVKA